ncbi:MAG: cytochrome c maturation protein CcmE [Bosea sp. (in: a-proteobacteria)]
MTRKQRRMVMIGGAGAVLAVAAGLVLFAMRDSIVFFYGPTEITEKGIQPGTRIRLGGLVEQGSVQRGPGQTVTFAITDTKSAMKVTYTGLLPDLFREGQGVITEGKIETSGLFRAESVLAKHDESYMPREVADALKKQGVWQPETGKGAAAKPATEASKP